MDKKNMFFFFNTSLVPIRDIDKSDEKILGILEKSKEESRYINILKEDKENIPEKKFIHYISAAYHAVKESYGIEYVLGACDGFGEKFRKILKKDFHADIRWAYYNKDDDSDTILDNISSNINFDKIHTVFILLNSGIRNNVMFFSTFTEILKARGLNVQLIYVDEGKGKDNPQEIKDVTKTNKYYDVLRAVELFTEVGNPYKLIEYYKESESLKNLFECMRRFYESIQLCRNIQGRNQTNTSVLNIYSEMLSEIDNLMDSQNNADIDIIMKLMLPKIKKAFKPIENEERKFLQILEWCSENDLILAGYFILDAEFNDYLLKENIVKFNGSGVEDFPSKKQFEVLLYSNIEFNDLYDLKVVMKKIKKRQNNRYYPRIKGEIHVIPTGSDYANDQINRYHEGNWPESDVRSILRAFISDISSKILKAQFDWENQEILINELKRWHVIPPDCDKIDDFYTLLMMRELIRKVRNNMAHSSVRGVIENDYSISLVHAADKLNDIITSEYNQKTIYSDISGIRHPPKTAQYLYNNIGKDIDISGEKGYNICKYILKAALKILTEYK